ncbi:MAG: NAD-binding protein [Oscillospiraceae bacterium]|nr:NAD-binding protein [Oscillospiraceae bacterium]
MEQIVFSTYGASPALTYARKYLESWGYPISPDPGDATHLLLPVPSFDDNGNIKGGGDLPQLRQGATVFGGNLPMLQNPKVDFLQDPFYLEENAAITARCAMKYAPIQPGVPVLLIGWGRIGKHLAALLQQAGADVTVAVRKASHLQRLTELGFQAVYLQDMKPRQYDVVFNTAPASVLFAGECKEDAVLIDLASVSGIFGKGVIWARGLPGKDAPEESGALIAKTALRYALGKELQV